VNSVRYYTNSMSIVLLTKINETMETGDVQAQYSRGSSGESSTFM